MRFGGKVHNSFLANNEKTGQKYSIFCLCKASYYTTPDHTYASITLRVTPQSLPAALFSTHLSLTSLSLDAI
jgi:hypothetical protein